MSDHDGSSDPDTTGGVDTVPPTSGPHAPGAEAVFEASPIALLMVDEHGVITLVNHHAAQLFGYARAELVGQSVEMLIPVTSDQDVVGVRKDRRTVPLEIGLTPIRTDHGGFVLTAIVDLTRRRQAEEALRLSEQRARAIFDQTFEFIGLLDPAGTVLDANPAALSFAGVAVEQVIGRPFWDTPWWTHSTVEQERLRHAIRQAAAGEVVRFETTHRAPDGALHVIDFSLKPVRDADGTVIWLVPEGRDITERKRAEDHEATANTLREILLRSAGDDMFADVLDLVRARFASRFGFLGYIRDSDGALVCPSMTRDIWDACAVEAKRIEFLRPTWGGLWGRVLLERTALIKNELHRTPVGHVPLHRSMGAPLVVDGELIGSIHLANRDHDYTPADLDALVRLCAVLAPTLRLWLHRRDAEELARRAQQHREELIATVEGIVWEADAATFAFTFVSAQAERLLGYPVHVWLESPTFWADHVHPHDRERAVDPRVTHTSEARDHSFEYRMLAADGRVVWVQDVVTMVVESGRTTKLRGIMMDITERKRAEAEHARLEAQLRQAQKMEAMGTLAGGIAHDFNNILAAILGNAALAKVDLGPDHPALGCLEAIEVSGDRATDLIRQILAFSRQERAQMEVISLRTVVEDDARLLRATLPAGVEFVTRLSACPNILANRTEIHQVLMNLCTGADAPRAASATAGNQTSTQVPRPGWLATVTAPWWRCMTPSTTNNPRPVPSPTALVVKNGSKIRSTTAASIPVPVSMTVSRAYGPGRRSAWASARSGSTSTASRARTIDLPGRPSIACQAPSPRRRSGSDGICSSSMTRRRS